MSSTRWAALFAVAISCGGGEGTTAPVTPPKKKEATIAKLIVASTDTGFWFGKSLDLSKLVVGAVTTDGDTVAAPAVTWNVPSGFVQDGYSLKATREARGALVVGVVNVPAVTVEMRTASLTDLATNRHWRSERRCYDNAVRARSNESPAIGLDSAITLVIGGELTYLTTEWTNIRAEIRGDERHIRFWKDGVIDTVTQIGGALMPMVQDTMTARFMLGSGGQLPAPRVSESPLIYRATEHTCEAAFLKGGTPIEIREVP